MRINSITDEFNLAEVTPEHPEITALRKVKDPPLPPECQAALDGHRGAQKAQGESDALVRECVTFAGRQFGKTARAKDELVSLVGAEKAAEVMARAARGENVAIPLPTPAQKREARMSELLDRLYEETVHRALCKPAQAETHAKSIREIRAEIMTMLTTILSDTARQEAARVLAGRACSMRWG